MAKVVENCLLEDVLAKLTRYRLINEKKSNFSVGHHKLSGEGIAMKSFEERGENIMSGKFQPKISLRNVYLYKVRCDCE